MPEWLVELWLRPLPRAAAVVGLLGIAAGASFGGFSVFAGFLAGVALATGVFHVGLVRPLLSASDSCSRIAGGDLSTTVPEGGPSALRTTTGALNTVLADFQEVLLLSAHTLHSVRNTLEAACAVAETRRPLRERVGPALEEVVQMQGMLEGFRYFRVRLEGGAITDTGISRGRSQHLGSPGVELGTSRTGITAGVADEL